MRFLQTEQTKVATGTVMDKVTCRTVKVKCPPTRPGQWLFQDFRNMSVETKAQNGVSNDGLFAIPGAYHFSSALMKCLGHFLEFREVEPGWE